MAFALFQSLLVAGAEPWTPLRTHSSAIRACLASDDVPYNLPENDLAALTSWRSHCVNTCDVYNLCILFVLLSTP